MIELDASTISYRDRINFPDVSQSFSHVVSSFGNPVLFVVCVTQSFTGVDQTNFAVTYGGVSMTKIGEFSYSGKYMTVSAFVLLNPPRGSNTVSITWTGNAGGMFMARSYFGVSQAEPVRPSSWVTWNGSGNPSVSVPTSPGDVILDGVGAYVTPTATGTGHSILYAGTGYINYGAIGHTPYPTSAPHTIGYTVGDFAVMGAFSIQSARAGRVAVPPAMIFQ